MKRTFAVLLSLGLGIGALPASALARVAANVPMDSHYYETIDKLSGMGYLSSLPNGARPYSRLQMARWALEAQERAGDKPLPGYLVADLADLEKFVYDTVKYPPVIIQKSPFHQGNFLIKSGTP